jgi:hypothetical protein
MRTTEDETNGVAPGGIGRDVILRTLPDFSTGKYINSPSELIAAGYPKDFIRSVAKTHIDDGDDDAHNWLFGADGKHIEQLHGVSDLDLLHALAEAVGAELADPELTNLGRGNRARALIRCIRRALGESE